MKLFLRLARLRIDFNDDNDYKLLLALIRNNLFLGLFYYYFFTTYMSIINSNNSS